MTVHFASELALVVLLALVVVSLFQALYAMLRGERATARMSKFLGRRLAFSAAVIALLLVLLATGVLTPHPRPY